MQGLREKLNQFSSKKIVCSAITVHSAKVFNSRIVRAFSVGFAPEVSTWNFQTDVRNHELQSYWESYKEHKFRLQQNVTIFIQFHKVNFRRALQCRSRTLLWLHVLIANPTPNMVSSLIYWLLIVKIMLGFYEVQLMLTYDRVSGVFSLPIFAFTIEGLLLLKSHEWLMITIFSTYLVTTLISIISL